MEWRETLQEILSREAMLYFNKNTPDRSSFEKHITQLTGVGDWDDRFLQECYDKFVAKINKTGAEMSRMQ